MKKETTLTVVIILIAVILLLVHFSKKEETIPVTSTPSTIKSPTPEPTPSNKYIPTGEINDKG